MKKVGITCYDMWSKDVRYTNYTEVGNTYVEFVRKSGAIPILIPTNASDEELAYYAETLDAIVFTGGVDVHPSFYGQPQKQGLGDVEIDRDRNDLRLLAWSFENKLPIFAVCRGLQILNVYLGGTLYQDTRYMNTDITHQQQGRGILAHAVTATEGSVLYEIFGKQTEFMVNSHHHQAIDELAPKLAATLLSPDGIVEGVELKSDDYLVVGTQFHPEIFHATNEHFYLKNSLQNFLNLLK